MKKLLKKRIPLLLTIILGLGLTLGAVYFMYYQRDERLSNLTTGLIKLDFKEKGNVIKLNNDVPVMDAAGLQRTPYTFTVENQSPMAVDVNIKLDVKQSTKIPLSAVRYGLYINDELVKKDYIHDDKILYTYEELLVNETIECKLRFWIDYYYDGVQKEFEALIEIEGESRDTGNEGITVTFDANGGTVDTTTKAVTVGENYGRLPIPTREGYTFKGWNGKNLFNLDVPESLPSDTAFSDTTKRTFIPSTYVKGLSFNNYYSSSGVTIVSINKDKFVINAVSGYGIGFPLINIPSGQYSLSYNIDNPKSAISFVSTLYYNDDGTLISRNAQEFISHKGDSVLHFSVPQNTAFLVISFVENANDVGRDGADVTFSNVQLEAGGEATEYEPYYITSNTKVVQNGNHTLKAIWEENS